MGLIDFLNSLLSSMETSAEKGYEAGSRNLKFMSDAQLLAECKKTHGSGARGVAEQKAYLDEARRRKLIKK